MEACSRLELRDFECQIVGNGPLEVSLKEQAALLGIQDRCRLRVPKPEGEIKRLLERSRMFVLACARAEDGAMDNLPTVIMEAMAAGLPVISTNVAAVSRWSWTVKPDSSFQKETPRRWRKRWLAF